jgi:hypothetical protein
MHIQINHKMENKTKNATQRKNRSRSASHYHTRHRAGTSFGQPVPIAFYLDPLSDNEGKTDRKKIVELFNTKS